MSKLYHQEADDNIQLSKEDAYMCSQMGKEEGIRCTRGGSVDCQYQRIWRRNSKVNRNYRSPASNCFHRLWRNYPRFRITRAKRNTCCKNHHFIEQQLESLPITVNPSVLSTNTNICRRNVRCPWFQEREEAGSVADGNGGQSPNKEGLEMPRKTILVNKHLRIKLPVSKRGYVRFSVRADRAVDTFVFDDIGLADFYSSGDTEGSYGGFRRRKSHNQSLNLPFDGGWHLIILNAQKTPVSVYFEVWS